MGRSGSKSRYVCLKSHELRVSFANKYYTDDPYKDEDDKLFDILARELDNGIVEVGLALKVPPVHYICIERRLYRKLYREAKEELLKQYDRKYVTRTMIIEQVIRNICRKYGRRG